MSAFRLWRDPGDTCRHGYRTYCPDGCFDPPRNRVVRSLLRLLCWAFGHPTPLVYGGSEWCARCDERMP